MCFILPDLSEILLLYASIRKFSNMVHYIYFLFIKYLKNKCVFCLYSMSQFQLVTCLELNSQVIFDTKAREK